jgi:flagellar biosynthesis protein FlhG
METELKDKFWAIGGGKGGVGKSIATIMLGTTLARRGRKTILVDADLGGSNLHTLLGIRYPEKTLADFLQKRYENIEDIMIDTPIENLKLISGADDILGLANPKDTQKTKILNHLSKLDADFIMLDLGAGTSFTTMDFFLYAPNKVVVLTPQITSIQNAYGFIKSSLYRKLMKTFSKDPECLELIKQDYDTDESVKIDSINKLKEAFKGMDKEYQEKLNTCLEEMKIGILVNMVRDDKEANVGRIVQTVAQQYLSLNLDTLGYINHDAILSKSINKMADFLTKSNTSTSGMCFYDIGNRLIEAFNERRGFSRITVNVGMKFQFPGDIRFLEGFCKNLSHSGIQFETQEQLSTGQTLEIIIDSGTYQNKPLRATINIIRVDSTENGKQIVSGKITNYRLEHIA